MTLPDSLTVEPPEKLVKPTIKIKTVFGCPRDFLGNRFVYAVISSRARGLSVGVNMNPDRVCSFDCAYCEVSRCLPGVEEGLNVSVMADELQNTLDLVRSGKIRELSFFKTTPQELLELRHVALSGDGEPTLCPNFTEAVQTVIHVRARSPSFFKIVLITNTTGLDRPEVQNGLKYFTREDEVWAKLDAGTQSYMNRVNRPGVSVSAPQPPKETIQSYMNRVNRPGVSLDKVMANILSEARRRPVVIQSLFPLINGQEPPEEEIVQYAQRLKELKEGGAQIPLVQIYSANRPTTHPECGHLPLKTLSRIAQTVRQTSGLNAEIF